MPENKNITYTHWNPQNLVCGFIDMSAFYGKLATSRDVSHQLMP